MTPPREWTMAPATLAALHARMAAAVEVYNADVDDPTVDPDYPVRAWYGPMITGDPADAVFTGYDGDPDGDFESLTTDEEWAGLGAKRRTERIVVVCSIVCLAGNNRDISDATKRIYAIYNRCVEQLRNDPSLGEGPAGRAQVYYAAVMSTIMFHDQTSDGLQTRIVFRVSVRTRTHGKDG